MSNPFASSKELAYGEPPSFLSKDFVTTQTAERPSEPGRWWRSGETFRINLSNIAQNELIPVEKACLQFSVAVITNTEPGGTKPGPGAELSMRSARDAGAMMPGTPAWGCPFFSNVGVAIPGLGAFSLLESDGESQQMVAARLMCSGGTVSMDLSQGRCGGFSIAGRAYDAGARDAAMRSRCVWTRAFWTNRGPLGTDGGQEESVATGAIAHYSVPLSLFSHLFNGNSAMFPVAFLATGGDLTNFSFTVAPASTALNDLHADRLDIVGAANLYIIDPVISYTKLLINSAEVQSALVSLYEGTAQVPVAPGVNITPAMLYKTVSYTSAFTSVGAPSGAFQVNIPLNQPSCRGLLVQFHADRILNLGLTSTTGQTPGTAGAVGTQWTGKHAYSLTPLLRNFQLRIGSMRIPLDSLSDTVLLPVTQIPGLGGTNPFAGLQNEDEGIDVCTTMRDRARLYKQGKHLFTPFMTDDSPFSDDALAPWWVGTERSHLPNDSQFFGPPASGSIQGASIAAATVQPVSGGKAPLTYPVNDVCSPALFLIPFESFPAIHGHASDGYALRGLDLRNVTHATLTGTIMGAHYGASPGDRAKLAGNAIPAATSWTVRATLAFDNIMAIAKGRTDTQAQFSLLAP